MNAISLFNIWTAVSLFPTKEYHSDRNYYAKNLKPHKRNFNKGIAIKILFAYRAYDLYSRDDASSFQVNDILCFVVAPRLFECDC